MRKIITDDPKLRAILAARARKQGGSKSIDKDTSDMLKRSAQPAPVAATPPPSARFESFGAFLKAVTRQASGGFEPDRRLVRAPTGAGETDPTGGGFLVPTEFETQLIGSIYVDSLLAPLCDRRTTDRPADVRLPAIDERSRADGSRWGGALSYWENEGDTPPTSLPRYRSLDFSAKKLIALVVATGELIRDVPLLEGHVRRAFAAEAGFRADLAILKGSGVGNPLGILNAPGTIQVAKANGQAPGTIIAENIAAMWSRLPAPSRKRAVWIINEDAESQLETLSTTGSASTTGMYFPAGTGGNPYALVKGRPVLVAEQASLLGTPGDISLVDLSEYVIIDGGLKTDLSLDVMWTSGQAVFRFVWRGDGKPAWATPITPYNGGVTRSPFVTLAQR